MSARATKDRRIALSEVADERPATPDVHSLSDQTLARASARIHDLLAYPDGIQNGKNNRKQLSPAEKDQLRTDLLHAIQHASIFAARGPLPNIVRGRGRPPD